MIVGNRRARRAARARSRLAAQAPMDQPLSSTEFEFADPDRHDDVERKQRRVAEFLRGRRCDALLLRLPCNFAWFTSGAFAPLRNGGEPTAALFVTLEARVVVASNVDAPHLFDRQLTGLGFQLKQRRWDEPVEQLLADLCRSRRVASDVSFPDTVDASAWLAESRLCLDPAERERLRRLAESVSHATEATARNIEPGQTELEVAGQLAYRLTRRQVVPVEVAAVADLRGAGYRRWLPTDEVCRKSCTLWAVGSRQGLHCMCSRTVSFGEPSPELLLAYQQAMLLEATGVYFSRPGSSFAEVFSKVRRIYQKQGIPDEWQQAEQAELVGYRSCEQLLAPHSAQILLPHMAVHWHPSVGAARVGDTMLVGEPEPELLTRPVDWPRMNVTVKGQPVVLPDILIKSVRSTDPAG